jgi:hypothetical protein
MYGWPAQSGPSSETWFPLPLPWPQFGSMSPTDGKPICCIGAGVGGIGGGIVGIGALDGIAPGRSSSLVVFRKSKFESRDEPALGDFGAPFPDGFGDDGFGDFVCGLLC